MIWMSMILSNHDGPSCGPWVLLSSNLAQNSLSLRSLRTSSTGLYYQSFHYFSLFPKVSRRCIAVFIIFLCFFKFRFYLSPFSLFFFVRKSTEIFLKISVCSPYWNFSLHPAARLTPLSLMGAQLRAPINASMTKCRDMLGVSG